MHPIRIGTVKQDQAMTHFTETGPYRSDHSIRAKAAPGSSQSIRQTINKYLNQPLPWVCVFSLIVMALIWLVVETHADTRIADMRAVSANQRISDLIAANAQIQVAYQQTINDIRNRAIDAETQALILRNHVDDLRQELAAHGIKPPAYPINLKGAK